MEVLRGLSGIDRYLPLIVNGMLWRRVDPAGAAVGVISDIVDDDAAPRLVVPVLVRGVRSFRPRTQVLVCASVRIARRLVGLSELDLRSFRVQKWRQEGSGRRLRTPGRAMAPQLCVRKRTDFMKGLRALRRQGREVHQTSGRTFGQRLLCRG